MNTKPILIVTAASLLAGFALAQQHQFREVAPRGQTQGRMEAAAPQYANRAQARLGGTALQAEVDGVVAEGLGLTTDELHALKVEGATIAQIAADRGVELADLEAAFLAARQEAIDALLAEATITDLQAETMAARGADAFAALSTREGIAGGRNAGGEPLYQFRTDAPRGPQDAPMAARRAPRGPGGRW
ncbi:MAG: hypothetical protein ABR510_01880 [Trueperaceae bacterium]